MSAFDILFALLSLLLGLSIAELLSGFSRVLRLKARQRAAAKGALRLEADGMQTSSAAVRVGWLVPLLGAYILLDQLSFFTAAWSLRDTVPMHLLSLLSITAVVGGYYLVATLVFPEEPDAWPDFDRYYEEHFRLVLGFALFAQLAQLVLNMFLPVRDPETDALFAAHPVFVGVAIFTVFANFPLLIAALRARSRRTHMMMLGLLVALKLVLAGLSPLLTP